MSAGEGILGALVDLKASDLQAGLEALHTLVTDVRTAFEERGGNMDHNLLAAQDLLHMLTGIPVIGRYASEAELGIAVLRFVIRNSDKNYQPRIAPEGHTGTEGLPM